ncbi:hypothetical protein BCR34DRAFT_602641 [Clohesyomyces aquaticus]|uniref:Mid2 domain-containing protein n=1 Tax=Clohesyomyces aquaticus TaxID=1231657 RepID=A0A1Y1ZHB3_9PLEO|nr:hypothetical protein BCR34DRAFT_602641 [Clohesyomyces aquaticus]
MSFTTIRSLPLPLISILLLSALAAAQQCYSPSGQTLDSTYTTCKPKSGVQHSGCCASTDICLDSGLCMATNGVYMGTLFQRGCTDPTGQGAGCAKLCPSTPSVASWNIQTCDYGSYCCRASSDHQNCCTDSLAPRFQTTDLGSLQLPTSSSPSSKEPTAPTPATAITTKPNQHPLKRQQTTNTTTTITINSSPSANLCPSSPSQIKLISSIIGGSLGAVILALLATILWLAKREKRQRKLKQHYESQVQKSWAIRTLMIDRGSKGLMEEIGRPLLYEERAGSM